MSENYQNSITDQICKVQTSKKLIALYDRLRYTSSKASSTGKDEIIL